MDRAENLTLSSFSSRDQETDTLLVHGPDRPSDDLANTLLTGLPATETARLRQRMTRVQLGERQYLLAAGDKITGALFPRNGWLYQIVSMQNGNGSAAGVIGPDGMSGLPLLFGHDRAIADLMSHAPCTAWRLDAAAFRASLADCPGFAQRLMNHALVMHAQTLQLAACNAHHSVEQRLARTLLMTADCMHDASFLITHELIAVMLGVRRAGVTVAAGAMQRAGMIRYTKGVLKIVDRQALEATACECYQVLCGSSTRFFCEDATQDGHETRFQPRLHALTS